MQLSYFFMKTNEVHLMTLLSSGDGALLPWLVPTLLPHGVPTLHPRHFPTLLPRRKVTVRRNIFSDSTDLSCLVPTLLSRHLCAHLASLVPALLCRHGQTEGCPVPVRADRLRLSRALARRHGAALLFIARLLALSFCHSRALRRRKCLVAFVTGILKDGKALAILDESACTVWDGFALTLAYSAALLLSHVPALLLVHPPALLLLLRVASLLIQRAALRRRHAAAILLRHLMAHRLRHLLRERHLHRGAHLLRHLPALFLLKRWAELPVQLLHHQLSCWAAFTKALRFATSFRGGFAFSRGGCVANRFGHCMSYWDRDVMAGGVRLVPALVLPRPVAGRLPLVPLLLVLFLLLLVFLVLAGQGLHHQADKEQVQHL